MRAASENELSFHHEQGRLLYRYPEHYPREDIYAAFSEAWTKGYLTLVTNDFDETISLLGPNSGINPFDTQILPQAGIALAGLEQQGVIVGSVSNRSAEQLLARYVQAGVKHPFLCGTYGFELNIPDPVDSQKRLTKIDPRFEPYYDAITTVQTALRYRLLNENGVTSSAVGIAAEETIQTPLGPIFVENKALCPELRFGLAVDYNMNTLPSGYREKLVASLNDANDQALSIIKVQGVDIETLNKTWGVHVDSAHPEKPGNYTYKTRPLSGLAKNDGYNTLLRAITAAYPSRNIGYAVYAGDHFDQDEKAIRANLIAAKGNLTGYPFSALGIQVYANKYPRFIAGADLVMKNSLEYAQFLQGLNKRLRGLRN